MNHPRAQKGDSLTAADVSIPTTVVVAAENASSNTSSSPPPSTSHAHIVLTPQEDELLQVLTRVMQDYNNQHPSERLQVRVAGGWVRDKLLGRPSHDLDLTTSGLSGVQFAERVVEYITRQQQEQVMQEESSSDAASTATSTKIPHVSVIAANPDQSKHLETATFRYLGLDIDVCALRSHLETYDQNSRIPQSSIGTPWTDAHRRDFTMNALFYNLESRQIEDWTQRGVRDLCQGIIVTPLLDETEMGAAIPIDLIASLDDDDSETRQLARSAFTTFSDDPLRVLRAIRFSVRYQFPLHPALSHAAQHPVIHQALHVKVSRERVGKELLGMMQSLDMACQALQLIWELKLAGSVFIVPSESDGTDSESGLITIVRGRIAGHEYPSRVGSNATGDDWESRQAHVREFGWIESQQLLALVAPVVQFYRATLMTMADDSSRTTLNEFLLPLAIALLPFRTLSYEQGKSVTALKSNSVIRFIIRDGIKFKNKDVHAMCLLMDHVDNMMQCLTDWGPQFVDNPLNADEMTRFRLELGLLLRSTKDLWVTCLLLATVLKLREVQSEDTGASTASWIQAAMALYQQVLRLELDHCWTRRPLLDGKAIMEALGLSKGPEVGAYMEEQVRWMLMYPHGSQADIVAHLRMYKQQREVQQGMNGQSNSEDEQMSSHHSAKRMHVE